MKSESEINWKKIKGICLDIDDTLSSEGKLTANAFDSLWRLKEKGFLVIPVTGRPAGWCDHIARFWPVDAVVGENGAFTFFMKSKKRLRCDTPFEMSASLASKKLLTLKKLIEKEFKGVSFASDQKYREFDLAVDFCEDVKPWKKSEVERLVRYCRKTGAHAKVSSIHVNIWYGDYDKWSGFSNFLSCVLKKSFVASEWLYIGDSPNDEPMFEKFENSVGVANIKPFLKDLKFQPKVVTRGKSGAGFTEMVDTLIRSRQ